MLIVRAADGAPGCLAMDAGQLRDHQRELLDPRSPAWLEDPEAATVEWYCRVYKVRRSGGVRWQRRGGRELLGRAART